MKILNPMHVDVFREEILNFISKVLKVIEKRESLKGSYTLKDIVPHCDRFCYLNDIYLHKLQHPFSKDLLEHIKKEIIIPIVKENFKKNKIGNEFISDLIQYSLMIFIHDSKKIMEEFPNIKPSDLEVNST